MSISTELKKVLSASPKAETKWKSLTPLAQRDFIYWIESAKQEATRKRRLESLPSRLLSGKRRPCCFNIVPMNLYKSLTASGKAKVQWKNLTPDERRDFVRWIDSAKDKETQVERVQKTIVMLASGKRKS